MGAQHKSTFLCHPDCAMATYHWSFNMSKHIAPVTELILGCQIFVVNFTCIGQIHEGNEAPNIWLINEITINVYTWPWLLTMLELCVY